MSIHLGNKENYIVESVYDCDYSHLELVLTLHTSLLPNDICEMCNLVEYLNNAISDEYERYRFENDEEIDIYYIDNFYIEKLCKYKNLLEACGDIIIKYIDISFHVAIAVISGIYINSVSLIERKYFEYKWQDILKKYIY
jgi:hypothetical protein